MSLSASRSTSFRQQLVSLYTVAVLINYPWERAQARFYIGLGGDDVEWWLCLFASMVDGLLILVMWCWGSFVLHQRDWYEAPGVRGYVVMVTSGVVISMCVEIATVYLMHWWSYSERMPLVPGLGIGVIPLAQMVVLPPIIFALAAAWNQRRQ